MTHLPAEILLPQASTNEKTKNKTEPTVSFFCRVYGGKREAEPTFTQVIRQPIIAPYKDAQGSTPDRNHEFENNNKLVRAVFVYF